MQLINSAFHRLILARDTGYSCHMDVFYHVTRIAFRKAHDLSAVESSDLGATSYSGLFAFARRHRLLNIIWHGLSDKLVQTLDKETLEAWRRSVYSRSRHGALMRDEATRVFDAVANDLPQLTLIKGPAMEAQAWPGVGMRDYDDLDFRCGYVAADHLLHVMKGAGYEPDGISADHLAHRWTFGWGASFRQRDGFMLEINHRFFPPQYPASQIMSRMEKALQPPGATSFTVSDVPRPTLSPALHLLLANMHGVWHGWERLAWLVDTAGLLCRHPGLYEEAHRLADGSRFAEACLNQGVQLAEQFLGPGLFTAPANSWPVQVSPTIGTILSAQELLQNQRSLMGPDERFNSKFRQTFTPGDGDFRSLRLPASLRHAYWFWRPVRLAGQVTASWFR